MHDRGIACLRKQLLHKFGIGDGALHQQPIRYGITKAATEIVQDRDAVADAQQQLHHVGADIAGAANDKNILHADGSFAVLKPV